MSYRLNGVLLVLAVILFVHCSTTKPPGTCTIAPPKDYDGDREAAAKVGADLTAFAQAPVKANVDVALKNKVKQTFQTIPEADIACQMLLQTVACLSERPTNQASVDTLLKYIREENKCGQAVAVPHADIMETLMELTWLEGGQAPVQFLLSIHCREGIHEPREQLRFQALSVLRDVNKALAAAKSQTSGDFLVGEFGPYRQVILDLRRRSEILSRIADKDAYIDGGELCDMAAEYERLHSRLPALQESYRKFLERNRPPSVQSRETNGSTK